MELSPKQQTLRMLDDAQNILLVTHQHMDGDGLAAMISLAMVLEKLGKKPVCYSSEPLPGQLSFLPEVEDFLHHEANLSSDFIIQVDCTKTQVDKLKYTIEDDMLNIYVTPHSGHFSAEDVVFKKSGVPFDTLIVMDAGDTHQLGDMYGEVQHFFHNSRVINIDHHVTNTHFGTVNWVEPKATSTCEIVLGLIEAMESKYSRKLLNRSIATHLLTGITVDTNSFQNSNTTPKAFSVSAQLLALGADQQLIIKNLYKTHSLSKLRLWGKALTNIKEDEESQMVWTVLRKQDFEHAHAQEDDIAGVLDQLIVSAPGADIVFLLKEHSDGTVSCSVRTLKESDASILSQMFHGGGHKKAAGFKIKGDSIEKIENYVVKKFRDYKLGRLAPEEIRPEQKQEVPVVPKVVSTPQGERVDVEKFIADSKLAIAEKPSNLLKPKSEHILDPFGKGNVRTGE